MTTAGANGVERQITGWYFTANHNYPNHEAIDFYTHYKRRY